jgi:TfoX/Sxy family transcriptional regulator of competence genes
VQSGRQKVITDKLNEFKYKTVLAYNQTIADKIRNQLVNLTNIEEKEMMGGIVFMYNEKMAVGVIKDELLCRIDPLIYEDALEKNGCRPMEFGGRIMKGWVLIDPEAIMSEMDLKYWINLALDFNAKAKKSKKRK